MLLIRFLSHPTTNRSTTRKLLTIKGVNTDYYDRHRPSVKVAATTAFVVVVSTFGAAAATTTTATINSGTKKTICNGKVPSPPRFGKSIPHDLVVDLKNNSKRRRNETHHYARFTTSSSLSENNNSTNNSNTTERTSSSSSSSNSSSSSSPPPNKSNCPLCQKYSQGPCGDLFQKWLHCIDSHPPGNQAECDSWMVPLDQCLKEHVEYYDSIQTIDPENDIDKDDTDKWRDFVQALDQEQEQEEAAGEGSIDTRDFPKEYEPQMELRPKDQTGFAMFCPRVQQDRQLLLAYIQDQDGNVLGAGSVEDLYLYQTEKGQQPQQSQQDEYYYVLRFAVTNQDCQSVTAYGLYACEEEEQEEEEEEHGDDTNGNKKTKEEKTSSSMYIRYTKTERIPKDYFHQSYK